MKARGENVTFSVSTGAASTGSLPIFDANGSPRTISGSERFILDSIGVNGTAATLIQLFRSSTSTTVVCVQLGVGNGGLGQEFATAYEGMPFLRATAPWFSTTGIDTIFGTGFIIYDGGSTQRSLINANLTPGGLY